MRDMKSGALRGCALLLVVSAVLAMTLVDTIRQHTLDRGLARAAGNYDANQVLSLLKSGANPNTRYNGEDYSSTWEDVQRAMANVLRGKPIVDPTNLTVLMVVLVPRHDSNWKIFKMKSKIYRRQAFALAQALLDRGADPNAAGLGNVPLDYAATFDQPDVINLLLQHGATIKTPGGDDNTTPLMLIAAHGHPDLVERFLAGGADVNAQDTSGRSVLMWAVHSGSEQTIKALLRHHPDLNAKDSYKRTALVLARLYHLHRIVALLETASAKGSSGTISSRWRVSASPAGPR